MGPVTRQDVQNIIETAKNRLLERVAQRQDVQALTDTVKNLLVLHQQNQQLLRQADSQRTQLLRRTVALEAKLAQFEQELRMQRELMTKLATASQTQTKAIQPERPVRTPSMAQYIYNPA